MPFVDLMRRAYLLLTDSGGIQEEGPSLGKPVIVMREKTERPEAVKRGRSCWREPTKAAIVAEVVRLLDDPAAREAMSRVHNPYGDGHASERIAAATSGVLSANRSAGERNHGWPEPVTPADIICTASKLPETRRLSGPASHSTRLSDMLAPLDSYNQEQI